jgi:hypothetical protein
VSSDSHISIDPGPKKVPGYSLIPTLVVLAILSFGASFLFYSPTERGVGSGQLGPISTSLGKAVDVQAPGGLGTSRFRSIDLRFQFRVTKFVTYENLFQTGPYNSGLRAEISPSINGHRSVALIAQFTDGTSFVPPLVDNVVVDKTYTVLIKIFRASRITAWVDRQKQFTYSFATPIIEPSLHRIAVGTGFSHTRPFDGVMSGFKLSFRDFVRSPSDVTPVVLQVEAALMLSAALILLVLRFSVGEVAAQLLGRTRSRRSINSPAEHLGGRLILVGLLLVVAGTTVLELITPPENTVLQRSGEESFRWAGVTPGKLASYSLDGAPQLFKGATSDDVSISFDMRLDATATSHRHYSPVVVSTMNGNQGINFYLLHGRELAATWGQVFIPGPTGALLSKRLARNEWIHVRAIMQHNQYSLFSIDGQQVSAFMWALPNLNVVPLQISIGGDTNATIGGSLSNLQQIAGHKNNTFGGSVRNVAMTVVLYRQPSSRVNYLLLRVGQLLAILAIAIGIIVLVSRFLSRLIPVAARVHRRLVLVIFGTAGIGIVANFLIDQLHVQQSPIPYIQRSSWIATQVPQFSDFTQVVEIFKSLNPYGVQAGNYPPVGFWLAAPFSWMSQYAGLFVFLATCVGFMLWWISRSFTSGLSQVERVSVIAIVFLSLPVSFAFDRANLDLLIFIMVVVATAAFQQKRNGLAAVWFGLASAAKIFPGLYLLLFLRMRKKYLALAIAVAICTTVLAMLGFDGSLRQNFQHLPSALFASNPGGTVGSTYDNNSLVGAAQGFGLAIYGLSGMETVWQAIHPFVIYLEVTGFSFLTWYLWRKEQSLWRSTTLVTAAFLLLPTVSYYYELIFILIPLALFVREATVNARTLRIACLFGLVLAPKAFFYIANSQVDFSVLLTAPLLVGLAAAVIHDGVCERRMSSKEDQGMDQVELGDSSVLSHIARLSDSLEE